MTDGRLDRLGGRAAPNELIDALTDDANAYEGRRCVYRLGYTAMELPGLPVGIRIGRVQALSGIGPVTTQRTSIVQRPGDELVFHKRMHPFVAVGDGIPLTVLEIEDVFPTDPSDAFDRWHAEAVGAAGALSALLDERLFQRPVLEDVVIYDERGADIVGAVDARLRLRHFFPYPFSDVERDALNELARVYQPDTPVSGAARWYLRAAQAGPVADGVVYLWIAIDALLGTDGDRVVPALKARFDELDIDLSTLPLEPGRLYGLRGDIVHKGIEQPQHLQDGYYVLEALTRTLLRAALGLASLWPAQVGQGWSPVKNMDAVRQRWNSPRVLLQANTVSPLEDR